MFSSILVAGCLLKVNQLHPHQIEVITTSGCVANIPIVAIAEWLPELINEHSRPLDPIEAAGMCVLQSMLVLDQC